MPPCQVNQHLRIATPEMPHRLSVHLVAFQSLSRLRCLCLVGLSVGRVAEAQQQPVALLHPFDIRLRQELHHLVRDDKGVCPSPIRRCGQTGCKVEDVGLADH